MEVYQRLAASEVGVLKAHLLKRFRLTEGGYWKKFKNSEIEPGETPPLVTGAAATKPPPPVI